MKNRVEIIKELENLAPGLSQMEVKTDFSLPENYFYDLSDKIQQRVSETPSSEISPVFAFFHSHFFKYSLGFLIIVVVGLSAYYLGTKQQAYHQLNNTLITEDYVLENVDEDLLIDYVSEMKTSQSERKAHNTVKKSDTKEEMENNLIENIDENLIIDAL